MPEVIQAAALAVALAGGVHQREVARVCVRHEALFQGLEQGFRHADADEAAGRQGGAVTNPRDRLGG